MDEAGKQRGLFDVELAGGLGEVAARCGFDAVQAIAEVHLVEIELENLVLRVDVLDMGREDDFLELPAKRLVAREKALSGELLGDRAAAFGAPALLDVAQNRRHDADDVDAAVLVESLILDRDHRLDQVRRHPVDRDLQPLLLEDREGRMIAGVEDGRRLRHVAQAANGGPVGKAGRDVVGEPDERGGGDEDDSGEHDDRGRAGGEACRRAFAAAGCRGASHAR